jgi:predicted AlkP superfamily pyrophosphatase or phosphodiesterase
MFWPGSEAEISGHRPSKYLSYSTDASKLSANDRVDLLFKWLETDRPDFVAMYFSGVDNAGHAFGPDSAAVNSSLAEIDQAVGRMMEGLKSRKLLGRSHVIIVSDHGMTSISRDKTIWIDESVDSSEFTLTDGTPVAFVLPNDPNNTISIFQRLQNASIDKHWSVYLKNDIPERFHYRDNIRIPPIIAIADLVREKLYIYYLSQSFSITP